MGLSKYKQKRSADKTSEPFGGKPGDKVLRFVIQKHDASHLHYDFRLELDGVLKSWAVPKGPSIDPSVKRLAMMVEDHPYDYRTFEGIIPKGQYGGGTVIVWDEGTYEPLEPEADKAAQERALKKQLKSGSLKFTLHGKKLKGSYALVKTGGMAENAWLLIKHKDKHAGTSDITRKDKSVVSGKTIRQMAGAGNAATPASPAKMPAATKPKQQKSNKRTDNTVVPKLLEKVPQTAFPKDVKPMLCTLVDKPVESEEWLYEVKWDGYRAVGYKNKQKVQIRSRNNLPFEDKYTPVAEAMHAWEANVVVDGEIIVTGENGKTDFAYMQNWRSPADGQLSYVLFDLLWYNGKDLTGLTLAERRTILEQIIPDNDPVLWLSEAFRTSGSQFLEAAREAGLEGIVAKRADSLYEAGKRSNDWLKIKAAHRQEVVIAGYTINEGTSKPFSALLAGVYKGNKLQFIGKIGTGFSIKQQKEMYAQFQKLKRVRSPFAETPDVNKPHRFRPAGVKAEVVWMKPELICEVNYTELTRDGLMRHPSFAGMRVDKKAKNVVLEQEQAVDKVVTTKKTKTKQAAESVKKAKPQPESGTSGPGLLTDENKPEQTVRIGRRSLTLTNLDKLYWTPEKISKREVIEYYHRMAEYILPYLRNRPQSLNRHPNGIKGGSFYQKDVTGKVPEWMQLFPYTSEDSNQQKNFLVASDEASLIYMASLGCIEMNPWSSTIKKPDHPTWCIIDLDPGTKNTFEQVILAAQTCKAVLDDWGVPGYCKTSGSTGLHIYIPFGAKYTYDQSREFARLLVTIVQQQLPGFTSLERNVAKRKGKMYLDFLQNRSQATIAAAYSIRPKPGATVSMPLHWDEVRSGLKMSDFTIYNAWERVQSEGDIFKPVLGKGIDLLRILKNNTDG
jgi:bifunctional non-homologous end joining protein LigD